MSMPTKKLTGAAMARLCVMMVALALATMCLSFGTIARYATADSKQDMASMAKFGVKITITDKSSFHTEYKSTDDKVTVKSSDGGNTVAPGTADTNGVTIRISGSPEVATKVSVGLNVQDDIFLKMQKDGEDFYYCPVVFTLTKNGSEYAKGNLQDISDALDRYSSSAKYEPGDFKSVTFKLTWEWPYIDSSSSLVNKWDTYLGDIAAGDIPAGFTTEDFCTAINYTISASVSQVD